MIAAHLADTMRQENWVVRNAWLERLRRRQPILVELVLDMMGPDEMSHGRSTGKWPPPRVIRLGGRTKRQTTLLELGFAKRARR